MGTYARCIHEPSAVTDTEVELILKIGSGGILAMGNAVNRCGGAYRLYPCLYSL